MKNIILLKFFNNLFIKSFTYFTLNNRVIKLSFFKSYPSAGFDSNKQYVDIKRRLLSIAYYSLPKSGRGSSRYFSSLTLFLLMFVVFFSIQINAQVLPGTAPVNPPAGGFQIEGNLQANTPIGGIGDWLPGPSGSGGSVLDASGNPPLNSVTTFRLTDAFNVAENNFSGGLKYNDNPNIWTWVTNPALAKCDINNALFHFTTSMVGGVVHTWLIVAADRRSNSGSAYIDFEFYQNTVTANTNGTFSSAGLNGGRTKGDYLLTLALTNGGGTAEFFVNRWDNPGGIAFNYIDQTTKPGVQAAVLASTNTGTVPVSFPAFGLNTYSSNLFVEAAIDLTALFAAIDPCTSLGVKTLLVKTKTSPSPSATIVDFINPKQVRLQLGLVNAGDDQLQCGTIFSVTGAATPSPGDAVSSSSWSVISGAATVSSPTSGNSNVTVTSSSATLRFTVRTIRGCTVSDDVILTVKPSPTVTVNSPSICAGSSATLNASSGASSPTYLWSPGGATTPSITVTPSSTTLYSVRVTDGATSCFSSGSGTVTVNSATAAPVVTTPVVYCLNATASPLSATGTGLLWYTANSGGAGSATAPTPLTTTAGNITYFVSQTITTNGTACEGARAAIVVTVNSATAAPVVTTPVVYCLNATASPLSATGTGLLWYTANSGGAGSATAPTPLTTTAGNITYFVSQTVTTNGTACEGARAAIVVTVNSATAAPGVTTPVVYCLNATASPLTATGTSLLWYSAGTGGNGSATAPTPLTTTAGNITYFVSQTVTTNGIACEGPRAAIVVTVNSATAAPVVTTPVAYCLNAAASPLSATGTGLLWYTAGSGGNGSATAPTPLTITAGNTTYFVSQTVTANGFACEGPRAAIVVTVNSATAAPGVTTPVAYCLNATASPLSATGTSLLWYTANNGGAGSATAPTPLTTTAGNITYFVSQTVTTNGIACEGARAAIVVTVNSVTAAPGVTTPVVYCLNATASPLTATGTSLLWYSAGTGGNGSATAPTPLTTMAGTTTYFVSQTIITNGIACEGARAAILVTVNSAPAAPAVTTPVVYCLNAMASSLSATGTGLLWYAAANGGTSSATSPTPLTTTAGTTTYFVSQTVTINGIACEGARAAIIVTINALPIAPTLSLLQPTCANGNGTVTVSNPIGSDYEYSNNNGTYQASVNFTVASNAGYNIKVKRINSGCISASTSGTMGFSVTTPAAAVVIQSSPTCSSSTGTLKVLIAGATTADYDTNIYEFSNNGGTFGSNPVFTFTAGQGYSITVRRIADNTCTATVSCTAETPKTVSVQASTKSTAPTEITNTVKTEPAGFEAYPVPFKDVLTIKYNFDYVSDVKIEVFNSQGKVILSKRDTNSYLNKEITLDLKMNSDSQQLYVVKVTTNRGSSVKKIMSAKK